MGVQYLQCVATAAVRDATNGGDFIAGAAEAGLDIRLLSGTEEAEAAGCGVLSAIPDAHGISVDHGGASLALAEIANGPDRRCASFPPGVLRPPALRTDGQQASERVVTSETHRLHTEGGGTGSPTEAP